MEINFSSDNRIVNWKYENKSYSYVVEGIIFATESNGMIFLEIYENKTFSYRFINLNGKDILWYDENGNLKLFDSDGHCINEHRYNELKTVKVSKDNIYLMYKNRISVLSRKGDEISKISPPFGYIFYRFIDGEKLSVICQGNNNTADKYGRNDWKFKYDFLNNTWHKESFAY